MQKKAVAASAWTRAKGDYALWRLPKRKLVKKIAGRLAEREYQDAHQQELAQLNREIGRLQGELAQSPSPQKKLGLEAELAYRQELARPSVGENCFPSPRFPRRPGGALERKIGQWSFWFASRKARLSPEEKNRLKRHWVLFLQNSRKRSGAAPEIRFNLFERKVLGILNDQRRTERFLEIFGIYNRLRKRTRQEIDSLRPSRETGIEETQ